ncbi:S26 family signal peptidase [Candidatus Poseidoniaceae archaeon]|nr:S26 family signal peptidase [Candidatus Poseidoniaceae archaeon]
MQRFIAVISGDSMWPTYNNGDRLTCIASHDGLRVGSVVVFEHPFHSGMNVIKRVTSMDETTVFVEGDQPDPTSSDDSHNFGRILRTSVLGVVIEDLTDE